MKESDIRRFFENVNVRITTSIHYGYCIATIHPYGFGAGEAAVFETFERICNERGIPVVKVDGKPIAKINVTKA